ncbi:hypothetical protein ACLBWH_09265 [Sphingomonas sp. M6A6_1c]|jgi:hypothetical protein|nr:hypothetical protein [Sphingomonas sp. CD22]MEA1085759.1 hypothetical protein [Sphingomonas sp. CD22]
MTEREALEELHQLLAAALQKADELELILVGIHINEARNLLAPTTATSH